MLVVGLDTSESPGSVALLDGADLSVEHALPEAFRGAENLLPALERLLVDCGRARDDIERICVNLGPGSFTGLRIGLAVAKGMCQARRIQLVGVDGTVAYRERAAHDGRVCVVISSRRDLVYARWFSGERPRTEISMARVPELAERLRAETRPLCVVGSAALRVLEATGSESPAFLGPDNARRPSALAVARVGARAREIPLHEAEPMYVEPILA